jgi:hypothetical protein
MLLPYISIVVLASSLADQSPYIQPVLPSGNWLPNDRLASSHPTLTQDRPGAHKGEPNATYQSILPKSKSSVQLSYQIDIKSVGLRSVHHQYPECIMPAKQSLQIQWNAELQMRIIIYFEATERDHSRWQTWQNKASGGHPTADREMEVAVCGRFKTSTNIPWQWQTTQVQFCSWKSSFITCICLHLSL